MTTTTTATTEAAPGTPPVAESTPSADNPSLLGTEPVVEPTAETKPEGETKPAAEVKPVEETKYEFQAPEGIEFDTPHLEKFTALAKELKLAPADAQKAVDLVSAMELERVQQHAETVKGWLTTVKTDKELGGDKLPESLATAKKTFDLLPPEQAKELKGLLNQTGLEAHPAFFRLFHAVGKALSEDKFVAAGQASAAKKSTAERLYPTTPAA